MIETPQFGVQDVKRRSMSDEIDIVCDAFEEAWARGEMPQIEDYLVRCDSSCRAQLFGELLLVDREFRTKRGECVSRKEYRKKFPDYSTVVDILEFATIADGASSRESTIRARNVEVAGGRIAHFELLEELGSGASGVVWKARDTRLQRLVAVKIPRQVRLFESERERFLREGQACAQLRHPGIVTVYEVGEDHERVFIVAELIGGLSLREWLKNRRQSPSNAAELTAQLADALHHAHEQGVIHRDLKPANVLMDDMDRPHIADFGLAKWCAEGGGMSVEGNILGTPAYMSPEQARGDSDKVDRRTDVYALGVLLYEMLTGQPPFTGDVDAIFQQVLHDEPAPLRRSSPRPPRDLAKICHKCLEKSPSDRYVTAAALAIDLRNWLANRPITARPTSTAMRAWKWSYRNRSFVSAAATIFLIGTLSTVWAIWQSRNAARSAVSAWITTPSVELLEATDDIWHRQSLQSELERRLSTNESLSPRHEMLIRLGLLPAHPEFADELARYMVLHADFEEFGALLQLLKNHAAAVTPYLTQVASGTDSTTNMRMRALIALRRTGSGIDSSGFETIALGIHELKDATEASKWAGLIVPWRDAIAKPLHRLIIDTGLIENYRTNACSAFARLFKDVPAKLAELVPDATDEQHRILCDALLSHSDRPVSVLRSLFEIPGRTKSIGNSWDAFQKAEEADENTWRQLGNIACALVRLDAWPDVRAKLALEPCDPRLRTYFIHGAKARDVPGEYLVRQLLAEGNASVKYAILLALGDYSHENLAEPERTALRDWLRKSYFNDTDSGVHSAIRWLLNRGGEHKWMERADCDLSVRPWTNEFEWYVNRLGMLMVLVPGTGERVNFAEFDRQSDSESRQFLAANVPNSFFISADEITWDVFQKFDRQFVSHFFPRQTGNEAINAVSMIDDAAEFCRRLTEYDGFSDEEQAVTVRGSKEKHLAKIDIRRPGYRWALCSEWQTSASAGTVTSRYFGTRATPYASHYVHGNNVQAPQVVGQLMPNRRGLFDVLGNMREPVLADLGDEEAPTVFEMTPTTWLPVMGGSYRNKQSDCNLLLQLSYTAQTRMNVIGLRVVRTVNSNTDDSTSSEY